MKARAVCGVSVGGVGVVKGRRFAQVEIDREQGKTFIIIIIVDSGSVGLINMGGNNSKVLEMVIFVASV